MAEEDMKLAAQALLPAILAAAGFWVTGLYGIQGTPANILLLIGAYLLGFGVLLYSDRVLNIEQTPKFYLYYACLALLSGLLGAAFLRQPLLAAVNSFLLLPIAMFILPAAFQITQERLKYVQPE